MRKTKMKLVLVTGANGYIGSHVVKHLLDTGAEVIAADVSAGKTDPRAEQIVCDIFTSPLETLLKGRTPDVCLHLVGKDGFCHSSVEHLKMLPLHYAFFEQVARCGIKQLAVMGSMHEVGYFEGAIDENTRCNPLSLYGIAKNALRQSTCILCRERNIVFQWLRGFYITGDDMRNNSVFTKILTAARAGVKEFPFVSGEKCCDFIKLEELTKQICAAILQSEVTGIINCCSGKGVSLRETAEDFIRENKLDIRLVYGAFPDRAYDSPAVWGDDTKIRRILRGKGNP